MLARAWCCLQLASETRLALPVLPALGRHMAAMPQPEQWLEHTSAPHATGSLAGRGSVAESAVSCITHEPQSDDSGAAGFYAAQGKSAPVPAAYMGRNNSPYHQ